MSLMRNYFDSLPAASGLSMLNRLNPKPYTNETDAAIIRGNLTKKRTDLLGKNDLCVCGTGKKQKQCHRLLTENSLVYTLWEKYLAFDKEVERQKGNKQFYCERINCYECCDDYFYVSAAEYFLIKNHILEKDGKAVFDKIAARSEEMLKTLEKECHEEFEKLRDEGKSYKEVFNDKKYLHKFLPCVLLDENGRCSAYSARPFICRFLGTSSRYSSCDKIEDMLSKTKTGRNDNMVEIAFEDKFQEDVDLFKIGDTMVMQKPYPFFYFFAKDDRFAPRYEVAVSKTIEIYRSYCYPP